MVEIVPFRGLCFDPQRVGDVTTVTAPPYDAIDTTLQRELHAASPYNVVRLELGFELRDDDDHTNRYTRAAAQFARWCEQGVLVRDPTPCLYVYEQGFEVEGRPRQQVGVLAGLRLEPWETGTVLPHERVFRGPVEDRKRLLRALPVNVSPLFVLYERHPQEVELLFDAVRSRRPRIDFIDSDRVRHRMWPLPDPVQQGTVIAALLPEQVLLADGHHRYTTALEYRNEPGAAPGAAHVLTYLVAGNSGPVIRPTHRLVARLPRDWKERLTAAGGVLQPVTDRVEAAAGLAVPWRPGRRHRSR